MPGTISFGGIGSGIDTEGIVTGLVKANSTKLDQLEKREADAKSAVSSISDISSLVSKLKASAAELADQTKIQGVKATSESSAVSLSALGTAVPGQYTMVIDRLAQAHRSYSSSFTSASEDLGQTGNVSLAIGDSSYDFEVESTDSLNDVVTKINDSGLRLTASTFFDGSRYRLQVRGLDSGSANAVTINDSSGLNLDDPANAFQSAQNARVFIDNIEVTSATNEITGAVGGVSITLKQKSADPVLIDVASDPSALQTKLQKLVDDYNGVIKKVHTVAGYGSQKASIQTLAGDSSLRSITSSMGNAVSKRKVDAGTYQSLASIGLEVGKDGTLSLDTTKLSAAVTKDAGSVRSLLAGDTSSEGLMDVMEGLATTVTKANTGLLTTRKEMLEARAKSLGESADRENDRLTKYADNLRKQFVQMDGSVSNSKSTLDYLSRLYG